MNMGRSVYMNEHARHASLPGCNQIVDNPVIISWPQFSVPSFFQGHRPLPVPSRHTPEFATPSRRLSGCQELFPPHLDTLLAFVILVPSSRDVNGCSPSLFTGDSVTPSRDVPSCSTGYPVQFHGELDVSRGYTRIARCESRIFQNNTKRQLSPVCSLVGASRAQKLVASAHELQASDTHPS